MTTLTLLLLNTPELYPIHKFWITDITVIQQGEPTKRPFSQVCFSSLTKRTKKINKNNKECFTLI